MSLEGNFICGHCGREVIVGGAMGTMHRNHCPNCLWSKHLDLKKPGDRLSRCHGLMEPIALTFKNTDRELMLVHACSNCDVIGKNRIAGDDSTETLVKVFELSKQLSKSFQSRIDSQNITIAEEKDRPEIRVQLFGK